MEDKRSPGQQFALLLQIAIQQYFKMAYPANLSAVAQRVTFHRQRAGAHHPLIAERVAADMDIPQGSHFTAVNRLQIAAER